ncbi:MAG: hypothetical protein GF315_12115 [candidate division Zixibacteria bacterium]|nr:hypothetical protein [candidate division Zixibacteria bacterium]
MNIDWVTFIAQVVNFIILILLLKRFLYDRIINAMDQREERINSRFAEADKREEEAKSQKQEYEKKASKLDEEKERIMSEAREEAEKEKKKLLQDARDEVEDKRRKWNESLSNYQKGVISDIRRKFGNQIYSISRKVLSDITDKELEKQLLDVFVSHIEEEDLKEMMGDQDSESNDKQRVQITSSFDIHGNSQKKIEKTLSKKLSNSDGVDFEVDDQMICGIELKYSGKVISWSIDKYLDDLENNFSEMIKSVREEEEQKTESDTESSEGGQEESTKDKS